MNFVVYLWQSKWRNPCKMVITAIRHLSHTKQNNNKKNHFDASIIGLHYGCEYVRWSDEERVTLLRVHTRIHIDIVHVSLKMIKAKAPKRYRNEWTKVSSKRAGNRKKKNKIHLEDTSAVQWQQQQVQH